MRVASPHHRREPFVREVVAGDQPLRLIDAALPNQYRQRDVWPETTADDIAGWDSMSQVRLAVEVEHRFTIKIKSAKMEEMRSVRGLLALIRERPTMATI